MANFVVFSWFLMSNVHMKEKAFSAFLAGVVCVGTDGETDSYLFLFCLKLLSLLFLESGISWIFCSFIGVSVKVVNIFLVCKPLHVWQFFVQFGWEEIVEISMMPANRSLR